MGTYNLFFEFIRKGAEEGTPVSTDVNGMTNRAHFSTDSGNSFICVNFYCREVIASYFCTILSNYPSVKDDFDIYIGYYHHSRYSLNENVMKIIKKIFPTVEISNDETFMSGFDTLYLTKIKLGDLQNVNKPYISLLLFLLKVALYAPDEWKYSTPNLISLQNENRIVEYKADLYMTAFVIWAIRYKGMQPVFEDFYSRENYYNGIASYIRKYISISPFGEEKSREMFKLLYTFVKKFTIPDLSIGQIPYTRVASFSGWCEHFNMEKLHNTQGEW